MTDDSFEARKEAVDEALADIAEEPLDPGKPFEPFEPIEPTEPSEIADEIKKQQQALDDQLEASLEKLRKASS